MPMPDILIRDLDEADVARLKNRAKQNRRSVQSEAKELLVRAARQFTAAEMQDVSTYWQRRLRGRITGDSTEVIRKDRRR
jgi:hypothetical protein